jgi:threonine/homoserine/homoserine lactone efflux protein
MLIIYMLLAIGLALCTAAVLGASIYFLFAESIRTRFETASIVVLGAFGFVLCVKAAASSVLA